MSLGRPRVHLRRTSSTNDRARELASAGAPHGTLVTAAEQTAGRGRQGRTWVAPPGSALLASLVLRDLPPLLSLVAAVAVCDAVEDRLYGEPARVKWPNDVVLVRGDARGYPSDAIPIGHPVLAKLAGILVEGRPQEGWAVLGIGINVALRVEELPPDLQATAASLGLPCREVEPLMAELLEALQRRFSEPPPAVLDAWRARDALYGREIKWESPHPAGTGMRRQSGRAEGIDERGCLLVALNDGTRTALNAGEVHLRLPCRSPLAS
jgi:BirA family transcriptional regulator, biotin operon repressor / biotin---[acetyl-CoA-carboxylase] ligase